MEEVRDWAEQNRLNQCHWFTVNDLFFLKTAQSRTSSMDLPACRSLAAW